MTLLKKYRKYIIALLLVSVLLLIVKFISQIDFRILSTYLHKTPGMFLLVILSSFIAYLLSSKGWMLCMGEEEKKISIKNVFVIRHIGEMLGVFNPTGVIAGDTLKVSYLTKAGITKKNGFSSILLLRMLNVLSSLFLIVLSISYLAFGKFKGNNNLFLLLFILIVVALGFLLAKYLLDERLYLGKTVEKISKKVKWSIFSKQTVDTCYEINSISSEYFKTNKLKFTLAFLLITFHWIFGALEFYIVLHSLHVDISIVDATAIEMGVSLFKSIGAIIPGQIGIEEYGNKVMLNTIGVKSNEIWFVASLVRRSRQLFWLAVAAIFFMFFSKKKSFNPIS